MFKQLLKSLKLAESYFKFFSFLNFFIFKFFTFILIFYFKIKISVLLKLHAILTNDTV